MLTTPQPPPGPTGSFLCGMPSASQRVPIIQETSPKPKEVMQGRACSHTSQEPAQGNFYHITYNSDHTQNLSTRAGLETGRPPTYQHLLTKTGVRPAGQACWAG